MQREFVHERQRNPHDCVLCSLAMFLGRPYDVVRDRAVQVCRRTDITWTPGEPMPLSLMRLVGIDYRRTIVTMQELPHGTAAMLTIASSVPHWLHVVFVDRDGEVHDPQRAEPQPFDPIKHRFAEAHVSLADLAPWIVRELAGPVAVAWPEIELACERNERSQSDAA